MEIINKAIKSFIDQGIIGFAFIAGIAAVLAAGIIFGKRINKKYADLLAQFTKSEQIENNGELTGERIINSGELKDIVEDFKSSARRGTDNINTEVIIQKRIDRKISDYERWIRLFPAISTALGLLGTFFGLTLAIADTKAVLGGIDSMAQFSDKMAGPFSNMATAFWTSVCGVIGSLILNSFNVKVENNKENFYDILEDYLDNTLYSMYAKNFTSQFEEFNSIIKTTMIDLTKEMRGLFQDGVKELVSKINQNTLDLTESMNGLADYTKDLDRLTKSLNKSVNNFKDPVDKFKSSIYEFSSMADDLSGAMKESINKFSVKVDSLDSNLSNLYDCVDSNKVEIAAIGNTLKVESQHLNNTYMKVLEMIQRFSDVQSSTSDELKYQVVNLNRGYENFDKGLIQFVSNLELLQDKISGGISSTLQSEMTNLTDNIVEKLGISMKEVVSATEQLTKNSIDIGQLIKQTNDFYVATINTNKHEVATDEN
ncbi:hypothetical protein GKZ28_22685 [Clostridium chromiireducens]|uniref:MotA/TolQ/ExbB proton channel domain-containing protein n=1 Tax=Clostridium chromiireducens TaxID=225345 RepID=A0A964W4F2_9CLOT|nr:hypothetical protein [Clostridium chromiireducens]MVX66486.1 hypothetical protein [Clostridium chromiireducens]